MLVCARTLRVVISGYACVTVCVVASICEFHAIEPMHSLTVVDSRTRVIAGIFSSATCSESNGIRRLLRSSQYLIRQHIGSDWSFWSADDVLPALEVDSELLPTAYGFAISETA